MIREAVLIITTGTSERPQERSFVERPFKPDYGTRRERQLFIGLSGESIAEMGNSSSDDKRGVDHEKGTGGSLLTGIRSESTINFNFETNSRVKRG